PDFVYTEPWIRIRQSDLVVTEFSSHGLDGHGGIQPPSLPVEFFKTLMTLVSENLTQKVMIVVADFQLGSLALSQERVMSSSVSDAVLRGRPRCVDRDRIERTVPLKRC